MNSELIERLKKCSDLPSIPSVAIKIIDCVRSQVDDVYEISKIIEQDPALAAKLMKCANSALYGQRRKYRKIQDAVILLGTRNTLSVALTLSLVNTLQMRQEGRMDYARFWKRSLLAAAYARSIERHICCTNTGEALLASLLQDIGMLALDRIEPTLYPPINDAADYHDAARAEEQTLLAVDHAAVGWWLLDTWGLPETITNAVERSHYPFASTIKSPFSTFDKTIVLSGLIADIWLNDDWVSHLNKALVFAHTWLNLTKRDFTWILGAHSPQVSEFEALFNIELLNKKKTDTLLETATDLLNEKRG
jgi:HD-like signal output (HDOD) protein